MTDSEKQLAAASNTSALELSSLQAPNSVSNNSTSHSDQIVYAAQQGHSPSVSPQIVQGQLCSDQPKESRIKYQIHHFTVDLRANDTVLFCIFKCDFIPKRVVLFVCWFGIFLFFVYNLLSAFYKSLIFEMSCMCLAFVGVITYISKSNRFIIYRALRSFLVWYKCIHAFIAVLSRLILANFWLNYEFQDIKKIPLMYHINGVVFCTNVALLIFGFSVSDGFKSKGNKIKRIGMISGILYMCWLWVSLYFDFFDDSINGGNEYFTIKLFGEKRYYFWRSISLTSLFKVIVFGSAQLYKNFKHPDRLNVIKLPVQIKYFTLKELNAMQLSQSTPNRYCVQLVRVSFDLFYLRVASGCRNQLGVSGFWIVCVSFAIVLL